MTIDIMMPFYGRPDHFKEAVLSVLAQDDPDWRLVIVDDVYPDLSAGAWASAIDDPRVTYLRNDINLRPSLNYRKCVDLMEADYAVLLGCDDVMHPGYVRRVKELIAQFPGVAIIQPGVDVIDAEGRSHVPLADRVKSWYRPRGHGARQFTGEVIARSLLRGNWTYFPSLCWNVAQLKKRQFRADLDVVQDLAMLLEIVADGGSLVLDDRPVFSYRRHAQSVSAVTGPDGTKFAQERILFGEVTRTFRTRGWRRAARAASLHVSSRLNAATELPAAVRTRSRRGFTALLRHVLGPS